MNLIEENRDRYIKQANSVGRVLLIVLGVIVFHVVVITAATKWHGWMPKQGEGLIKVAIYPDKPGKAPAAPR